MCHRGSIQFNFNNCIKNIRFFVDIFSRFIIKSALTNGGTISRCAENHVRDTQDFMEMSEPKATRGFRNVKCPSNRLPTLSDKSIGNKKTFD